MEENILHLKTNYQKLVKYFEITVTTKLHMIFDHVVPFYEKRGYGLGIFCEQAAESIHFDFEQNAWAHYKVKKNHQDHGFQLKKAVLSYYGNHVLNLTKCISDKLCLTQHNYVS